MPPSSHPKLYSTRLSPHQVGAIRYQIVRLVERGLSDVEGALDGTGEVSPQQAALFLKLLDKVLPRTRKAPKEEPEASWIRSLSVADLQRLLAETLGEASPAPARATLPRLGRLGEMRFPRRGPAGAPIAWSRHSARLWSP